MATIVSWKDSDSNDCLETVLYWTGDLISRLDRDARQMAELINPAVGLLKLTRRVSWASPAKSVAIRITPMENRAQKDSAAA